MSRRKNRAPIASAPVSRRKEYRRDYRKANAKFLAKILVFFSVMAVLLVLVFFILMSMEPHVQILPLIADNPKSDWQISINQPKLTDREVKPQSVFFVRNEKGNISLKEKPEDSTVKFAGNDGSLILFADLKTALLQNDDGSMNPVVGIPKQNTKADDENWTPVGQLAMTSVSSSLDWSSFEDLLEAVVDYGLEKHTTIFPINLSKRRHLILACDLSDYETIGSAPITTQGFVKYAIEVFERKKLEWKSDGNKLGNMDLYLWLSHSNGQRSNLKGQSNGFRSIFRDHFESGIRYEADAETATGNGDGYIYYDELKDFVANSVAVDSMNLKSVQTPLFLATGDEDFIVTKIEKNLDLRDKPIFFTLTRQRVEELDRLWKDIDDFTDVMLLDSPSELQRATFMLVRMERLWAQGLSTEQEGDSYSNQEFSNLKNEVERIKTKFAERYDRTQRGLSLAVRASTYRSSGRPTAFCTSLWEAQKDVLNNPKTRKFNLGLFSAIDEQIDESDLGEGISDADRKKKTDEIRDKRNKARAEEIRSEWNLVDSSPFLPTMVWLALTDEGQKEFLTKANFDELAEGTPVPGENKRIGGLLGKSKNGETGLAWSELAFFERIRTEIDWDVVGSPNRLVENQNILHHAFLLRDASNKFAAELNPLFTQYFRQQFDGLESRRRILEDRLFANDLPSLSSDFEMLYDDYDDLLSNYSDFSSKLMTQRKNLLMAPHFLNYCLDNWITDYSRGEEKLIGNENDFIADCENFLNSWAALEKFSPSEFIDQGFSEQHSQRLKTLNSSFAASIKKFDDLGISPSEHLGYVEQDTSSNDAENFSKSMLLIRSPLVGFDKRAKLRERVLKGEGSDTTAQNESSEKASAVHARIVQQTIQKILELPSAEERFGFFYDDIRIIDKKKKAALNTADLFSAQHWSLANAHRVFESNPFDYELRDGDAKVFAHFQVQHQQLCFDRLAKDLWAKPQKTQGEYYFQTACRVVNQRNKAFKDLKVGANQISLDELDSSIAFVDQFKTQWEKAPSNAESVDENFLFRFTGDVNQFVQFANAVTAWTQEKNVRQAKVFSTWNTQPFSGQRPVYKTGNSGVVIPTSLPFRISLRGHDVKLSIFPKTIENTGGPKLDIVSTSHSVRGIPSAKVRINRTSPPVRANIVLVLDCSKSMTNDITKDIQVEGAGRDQREKSVIAIESITEFIDQIGGENSYRLNMLAFGASYEHATKGAGVDERTDPNGQPEFKNRKGINRFWRLFDDSESRLPQRNVVLLDIDEAGKRVNLNNQANFIEALSGLDFVGQTPLFYSIDKGLDVFKDGFRERATGDVQQILIVISDGVDLTYSNKALIENSLAKDGSRAAERLRERIKKEDVNVFYFNFGSKVPEDFDNEVKQLGGEDEVKKRLALMSNLKDLNVGSADKIFQETNLREKSLLQFLREIVAPPNLGVAMATGNLGPWPFLPFENGKSFLEYPNKSNAIEFEREFLGQTADLKLSRGTQAIDLRTNHGNKVPLYSGLNLQFVYNQSEKSLTTDYSPVEVAFNKRRFQRYSSDRYPNQQTAITATEIGFVNVQFWNPTDFTVPPKFVVLQIQDEKKRKGRLLVSDYELTSGPGENISELSFSRMGEVCRRVFELDGKANFKMYVFENLLDDLWTKRITSTEMKSSPMEFEFNREFVVLLSTRRQTNDIEVSIQVTPVESTNFDPESVIIQPILPNGEIDFDAILQNRNDKITVRRTRHVDSEGKVRKFEHVFLIPSGKMADPKFGFGFLKFDPGKMNVKPAVFENQQDFGEK